MRNDDKLKLERHSMATKTERTFEAHRKVKDEDGQEVIRRVSVTEKVAVCDLYTPAPKGDSRVFWRGARIA